MSDIEQQAKSMGWVPQDQWKGDPDKWTDAETYVERGEHVLPILRANNRKLHDDVLTLQQTNGKLSQELAATRSIVQGLESKFNESLERQLKEQRASLKASLKEAVEDRDVDRELEIRDQLNDLTEAERASKKQQEDNRKKLASDAPTDPKDTEVPISDDFKAWKRANPWYGGTSAEDRKKTKAVIRAAEDLREDGDTSTGTEFFEKAVELAFGTQESNPPVDKVDSGNARSSSRGGGAKGFSSLPAEAREACMADVDSFVGEDKLFKTEKEWQDYYVKTYYGN